MPDLSFGLFSGFLPINGTDRSLHYVAALSERDPYSDPVVFWFNGGPGCSSLIGFAQENGPYIITDEPGAKFQKNPHSWNREATVVYLESPAGVGFSTCGESQCSSSDNQTANDNMIGILNFFTMKFPELKSNDLYISGESYAGIYIPYLMHALDTYITSDEKGFKPALKGMMVGNGLTSYQWDCIPAFLDMAVYHNLLDDELHARLKESCTWKDLMVKASLGNATCDAYFDVWMTTIDKLNIYNIYAPCVQN
jgi:carboxypeptidase C (cathepsin A)